MTLSGKTKRKERTEKRLHSKRNPKRKGRSQSKAQLRNLVSLTNIPDEDTIAIEDETMHEPQDCLGFDSDENMLKELHEPDSP